MQTLLSGLSEEASHAYVRAPLDSAVSMDWQPASRFLSEAEMATDIPARRWVWLYRAPWAWLAEGASVDAAAALHQWQLQQRAVLQLRRHLRQRLILINVDRVTPPTLATLLGFSCRDEYLEAPSAPSLIATLASLFEEMASEFWTLYEALEAVAWLPNGEAEFRSNRVSPPSEGLTELLELIHAGMQLPGARNEITQIRVSSQSVREENDLLLAQLHQVQEELEKSCVQNVSFSRLHSSLEQELTQAAADQQQLTKDLDDARATLIQVEQMRVKILERDAQLRAEAADVRAGLQSVVEENDVLLAQLHQVQEELEHYYLANREILAAMGQSERTLHRARNVISRITTHA
jgi:hypothetical protein